MTVLHSYVKQEGYVLITDITTTAEEMREILNGFIPFIKLEDESYENMYNFLLEHDGLDFVCVSYYDHFLAPSHFKGFQVAAILPLPEPGQIMNEEMYTLFNKIHDGEKYLGGIRVAGPTHQVFTLAVLDTEVSHILESRNALLSNL